MHPCFARTLIVGIFACLSASFSAAEESKSDPAGVEFFEKHIRPVLVAQCYECHSAKAKIVQGGLYLDTRDGMLRGGDSGPAIVAGESNESLIVGALRHESFEMPPKGKLPDTVIADFVKWIDMGAADPRDGRSAAPKTIDIAAGRSHWAYQPPSLTKPPNTTLARKGTTLIDRYLLAALETNNLKPAAEADPYTLVRRVYLDLTGLPPSPSEIDAFVADESPQAFEKLVDRLLALPQFGERWGRHWLDVVRYAESVGKDRNSPYRMAWRYRDYVIDSFNRDKPFDEFIREQLAGDLLPSNSDAEHDEHLIATSFLAIGSKVLTERVVEQYLLDIADEQLDVTCRAFMATTAGCARCHDHKFDPIPTSDYYALAGIFRSTECMSGMKPPNREFSYARTVALSARPESSTTNRSQVVQAEIAAIDDELFKIGLEYRAANRNTGKNPERDKAFTEHDGALRKRLAELVAEIESVEAVEREHGPRFTMGVREREAPADYAIRIRGEVADLGPVVPRGFLSVLKTDRTPTIDPAHSGRLELAEWIASRDNPLTARVFANRAWQHLFGAGLVTTTDDFGQMGSKPSHPELLDYLAIRFMDEGWSVKRLLREIVLSQAYRRSNRHDDAAFVADPDNRLLWRFSRRRLEGEVIRDSILAASGMLDLRRPAGSRVLSLENTEIRPIARSLANDLVCRSVYLPMLRSAVPESLGLFDVADPSLVVGRREVTTVAPQALFLLNSNFVLDQSTTMAERLLERTDLSDAERVDLAYRIVLARSADDSERGQALEFIESSPRDLARTPAGVRISAWTGLCQALFGSAEFRYVY